jgi:hypothetical protein
MEEMMAHYEDTISNTFFSQLINLKKKGSVVEHIENFQRLNIKVTNILDEHLIDLFIGTLKVLGICYIFCMCVCGCVRFDNCI